MGIHIKEKQKYSYQKYSYKGHDGIWRNCNEVAIVAMNNDRTRLRLPLVEWKQNF